jgi:hypothetical protein
MLETTLSTQFLPSANLKGQVAGANWLFLLPSLPLERAICLGMPTRATLTALAACCREVAVLCSTPALVQEGSWETDLDNVDWGALNRQTLLQWPAACVDVVVLVDRSRAIQFGREAWLQQQVHRLLKTGGLIYYEVFAAPDPLHGLPTDAQARFWLTPLTGEVATIVPLHDHATIAYFTERRLYSPSLKLLPSLKRLAYAARGRTRGAGSPRPAPAANGSPHPPKPARAPGKGVKSALRSTSARLLKTLDQAGNAAERYGLRSRLLRRTAVISGGVAQGLDGHPPAYLGRAAAEAGIALDHHRWGMVAPADYSSRKLLFFIFEHGQTDGAQTLRYIVKMVRNPRFNARLENERAALTLLQAAPIQDHTAIPRVVFSGYHADLALVGESAIEGVPFRSRTTGDVDCPYFYRALDWLTDLGCATATWRTSNIQAATVLHGLLGQFLQFYRLTPEHHAFLSQQIERIAASAEPLPAVFQHGDPGLWNLLVTPTDQVAFLDWEAAEPAGMPLWDLLHLIRSFGVQGARMRGVRDSLVAVKQQLLADTPLRRVAADAIRRYAAQVPLSLDLVQPLIYTCWMHRAIKEASRLPASRLERGHYVNLLRLCIDEQHTVAAALQPAD